MDMKDMFPPMTGEEVYALLSSGVIYLESRNYVFELNLIPDYESP